MDHPLRNHPNFIEASAGTGKTHLIMQMLGDVMTHDVENFVKENRLLQCLVLTFTEKAAGELKARLKLKILELYDNGKHPEYYQYLRDLDQVTISTIHGFCNMVLTEYPVETQNNPNVKLTSNEELIRKTFYELKRSQWEGRDKESLANDILISDLKKQEDIVVSSTSKLLADTKDYVFPRLVSLEECIDNAKKRNVSDVIITICEELKGPTGESIFAQGAKGSIPQWMENWSSLELLANAILSEDIKYIAKELKRIAKLGRSLGKDIGKATGFDYFLLEGSTIAKKLDQASIQLQGKIETVVVSLKEIFPINQLDYEGAIFLQNTVNELTSKTKAIIDKGEYLTYDQMILKVYDVIVRNPNQTLVQSLQERFQVCILDEFQDTDKNQYRIFKTLFLDKETKSRMLFCIGDPKQSIYGFRGADIGIYLEASSDFEGSKATLETNYRSTNELIHGLNTIFHDETKEFGTTYFFPIEEPGSKKENYLYHKVVSPDSDTIKYKYVNPNESAIHIFDFKERFPTVDKARNTWAETIRNEIKRIQKKETTLPYNKKGEREIQEIKLKDIAILCGNQKETELVEFYLTRAGIPCSIYKQRGIYQSREADQIQNLLECLLSSNSSQSYKKILFSDIFYIHPLEIQKFDEHSIDSYEKSLIDKWQRLVKENRYASFFRSVMDETKLFWLEGKSTLEWERKRTNFRQIFQKLLEIQLKSNCSLQELLSHLRELKQKKQSPEEEPLFDRETEEDSVQILTIHASKGLEWPVVFLFYFGNRGNHIKNKEYPIEIETPEGKKRKWILDLWDLNPDKDDEQNHFLNEQKRLLYVALTRPNLRLYLPKLNWGGADKLPNSGYSQILYQELNRIQSLRNQNPSLTSSFIFRDPNEFAESNNTNPRPATDNLLKKPTSPILYPSEIKIGRVLLQHSYTSLQASEKNLQIPQEEIKKELEETPDLEVITTFELPSSAKVGNFLHNILELCDFSLFQLDEETILQSPSWKWAYQKSFARYPVEVEGKDSKIESTVAQLLKNAMTAKIHLATGNSISLSELKEEEKSAELKFHLFLQNLLKENGASLTEGFEHYLKGAIDLVFVKDQKFYIVDYKSNLLPNNDYSVEAVVSAVRDKGYLFQKSVYSFILFEYLKSLFGPSGALDKFGGVFYLFLRGMSGDKQTGIYSDLKHSDSEWTLEQFEGIKKEVMAYIRSVSDQLEKVYS
ncbi:exodeoxyribonuclease V subunit beta [Leptospira kemamanensis]|uniref:RecBCD enzyme subunit RecB n=1 Tax=Leptospira kemamanensis TaxID=2484942 RepID=A0A4R9JY12_9LEPT|nr:UvrD-helicase domain-containing protein [Leptospira kemamanensis]TGL57041.1 exodeoxyribonuclease V subunit beta [Leptospira kemamanensis]